MLKRHFDPMSPHRVVIYLRMSSDQQNPRSPEQQLDEIRRRIQALRLPWIIVAEYRDEGKKGALIRRRPGFQQMLQDIRAKAVNVDLILVDTGERLGRTDDLDVIRKELREQHGVLIVTAQTNFSDPTTPQGRIFESFEGMRATQENVIKAHQVLRGKRDIVLAGFWPGGPRPFGFQLIPRTTARNGVHIVEGSVLELFSDEDWIMKRLFDRALATGEGQTRLAQALNTDDEIPDRFKPFHGPTVGYWLDQEIYYGELVWPKNSTGIVNDVRRVEPNPVEELLRIPNFCPSIVQKEQWEAIQQVREARRQALRRSKQKSSSAEADKRIAPLAPGMTLAYLLTGLVRCGHCNSSMRPVSSGRKSKAGRTYAYYACPRAIDGNCANKTYIPEEWLRTVVVDEIRQSLFPEQ